ncbi:DUF2264 domain-containing protein [Biostraticola tofi]|uniref:DUF2264 domain-containing protein n=1 Tax=Biostraticola tofi TaxID=466109 RepID=A0A4R3Z1M5_9GAMM|nr:DUF2264 domain-containing protein [Biostraticola tofi]TCV98901.1 hypothetical protein EDC52_102224 [Biostraticola tofi]
MQSEMNNSCHALEGREDVIRCLNTMLDPVDRLFNTGETGIIFGQTCAHYPPQVAQMEGLSRLLWGIFPLIAGNGPCPYWDKYLTAIRNGTDPQHPGYWGITTAYDQRLVEMAVYGLGLALLKNTLTDHFTPQQLQNLFRWLDQISSAEMPDSNWNYFAIMVQLGFRQAGLPWDQAAVDARFEKMEAYYLGDGWYSDGPGRPKDYYISMAFHYYGLIYATLMKDSDSQRSALLIARSERFAEDFVYLFAADGAAVPFGRSLTYRFAEAAFWSAAAFANLQVLSMGEIKGIILRHLRWWFSQPIFDRDGILTIGYAYPNLVMAEDYNSPGSPYWAFKIFLVLALPAESEFWQQPEQPLPALSPRRTLSKAGQILVHSPDSQHVYMLTSGQLELNNYVNTEAKYTKFAYSSRYGFTVERGRYGIKHAACDSMLLLADQDNYYRGRRDCSEVQITDTYIRSVWLPWKDVRITTWLVPFSDCHIRIHHIDNHRSLDTVEGGFAVIWDAQTRIEADDRTCLISASNGVSRISQVDMGSKRQADKVITPPNSSIMFAACAAIPVLTSQLDPGEHWLCCAVSTQGLHLPEPEVRRDPGGNRLTVVCGPESRHFSLN